MKLKNTILALTLLSLLTANAFAAQKLAPEKAAELKPFERINVTGLFNAMGDVADAVRNVQMKLGAAAYFRASTTATATVATGASRPTFIKKQTRRKPATPPATA